LFEAGALAKSMQDGRVIPVLLDLDVKDVSGPLAQFQAKKVDSAGIKELAVSLNKAAAAPVPEVQLDKLISALWGDLEKQISAIPKGTTPVKHSRPQGEILEELVSSIRNVEMRFRDFVDGDFPKSRRRHMRFHPMMMRDMLHFSGKPGDPIGLLILASSFRDEAPWIYELALETYRRIQSGSRTEAREAWDRFIFTLESMIRGPLGEVSGLDTRLVHEMFKAMSIMRDEFDIPDRPRKVTSKATKPVVAETKE
jgi:hypothetical protein